MYALSSAIAGAFAGVVMRHMREGIHYTISPFWFSAGCSFLSPLMFVLRQDESDEAR